MVEGSETKVDRWHPYAAKVGPLRVMSPQDVDEKIEERLASHKFHILESLIQILESAELMNVSTDIQKARKELRKHETELHEQLLDSLANLGKRLSALEKNTVPRDEMEDKKKLLELVEQSKDTLEELNILRDKTLRDFVSKLGDKEGKPDE